jgi:hypothetical protein
MGVHATVLDDVVEHADHARLARLSQGLRELPPDWAYGDPLRVGQKVVFTGCDPVERTRLESRAESVGVRVIGAVSKRVAMLVTDGTSDGTKAAEANRLGVRIVKPEELSSLLDYLQPARLPRHAAALTLRSDIAVANSNGVRTLSDQVVSPDRGEQPARQPGRYPSMGKGKRILGGRTWTYRLDRHRGVRRPVKDSTRLWPRRCKYSFDCGRILPTRGCRPARPAAAPPPVVTEHIPGVRSPKQCDIAQVGALDGWTSVPAASPGMQPGRAAYRRSTRLR